MKHIASLVFNPSGTAQCLYFEEIDLHALGTLRCERASRIEFDAGTQQWEVMPADSDTVLYRSPSRQQCLAWERQHLAFAV